MGGIFDGVSGDAVKKARAAMKAGENLQDECIDVTRGQDDVAVKLLGEIQEGATESCVRWIFGD